ncbi:hypothetical protein OIE73_00885 [Streptomyces hirsutus]|uniref:Transposase IS4-like domain-containing protein n=2 Tax=Streptomyces hirsutus TaxID=35620 RepID=A0ABZ1GEB7_9ACTN|nr:transposase [Streptomyces hirsutus]WSD04462.1 hypothetical protein OIE73_00885 [Streptomyces hirsutus]
MEPQREGDGRLTAALVSSDWLLLADRGFYSFATFSAAAQTGAALCWRPPTQLLLPILKVLSDGTYLSALIDPAIRGRQREELLEETRSGAKPDPAAAHVVRVVEYDVPDRDGKELICLITSITDPDAATAAELAGAYHQRWEEETANGQLKSILRGPGKVLRSKSPDLVHQEIWAYLLVHYAINSLTCQAATGAGIDPDRISFLRTLNVVRRTATGTAAFPPERWDAVTAEILAMLAAHRNCNPEWSQRSYPRVVKRARHNSYRVKRATDAGIRHAGPPIGKFAFLGTPPTTSRST